MPSSAKLIDGFVFGMGHRMGHFRYSKSSAMLETGDSVQPEAKAGGPMGAGFRTPR